MSKIIVGKPMLTSDASNGYVEPAELGGIFTEAEHTLKWNRGVMVWQWHGQQTSQLWVNSVYPKRLKYTTNVCKIEEIYGYKCR